MSELRRHIGAKVARAKQHIQDFQSGLIAFRDSGPYGIETKRDPETGARVYYISKLDEVPDELATIAADVLKNLREPLDHIAYQLVLAASGSAAPHGVVYYPITATASDYPSVRGKIQSIRKDAIQAIDATEPYAGGKGHGLWQLNALCKIDKHQLLVVTGSFVEHVEMRAGPPLGRQIGMHMTLRPTKVLKVGDEVFRDAGHPHMNDHIRIAIDVSFNHPGIVQIEPALKTLQDFTNLVDPIVSSLTEFLP